MILFWDSSAVLPLIFKEIHSEAALDAWEAGTEHFAWDWMEVETHAAVVRRTFDPSHLRAWRLRLDQFSLFGLPTDANGKLMAYNETWGLRSADAGHVFLLRELQSEFPEVRLVAFDQEMIDLAQREKWPLWKA